MRYRAHDINGDYQFGRPNSFHVDNAAAVAQAILTRLRLMTNEWFLDVEEGTPYDPLILGHNTAATRDLAIRERILGTPGVKEITEYTTSLDARRKYTVNVTVSTIYGDNATVTAIL